jgi:hypothetical protein
VRLEEWEWLSWGFYTKIEGWFEAVNRVRWDTISGGEQNWQLWKSLEGLNIVWLGPTITPQGQIYLCLLFKVEG